MINHRFLGNDIPEIEYNEAKVIIIPAPMEETVSYGSGTRKGPEAILRASSYVELYDEELVKEQYEIGIHTASEISPELSQPEFLNELEARVYQVATDGKYPVIIGGEHSLSIAPVKAFKQTYHQNFSVLHLDAHSDLRHIYQDSLDSHACVMRRIYEQEIDFVSVGIRSLSVEEAELIEKQKLKTYFAKDIYKTDNWIEEVVSSLNDKIYITLDVDVFDPSVISHTGTPEPGGLTWYPILKLFKKISHQKKQVIGFDLVEFSPKQHHDSESFTCAKLIYKMIGYFYS